MPDRPVSVYIIDDDASFRCALTRLFRAAGLNTVAFDSAASFLGANWDENQACAVVDIRMPGMTGLQLQEALNTRGCRLPIIFVTAYDTDETCQAALDAGAAAYFRKPVDDQALLDAVRWAVARRTSH